MPQETRSNKAAKVLYRPVGMIGGLLAGAVAGQVFKQVWRLATPGHQLDAPGALQSEYRMREVLIAAAVQGAVFGLMKAAIDRGGARLFERWTGEWPGD